MSKDSKTLKPPGCNGLEIKIYSKNFNIPVDQEEYLKNLAIGSEFELQPRGLFEFYGMDLIAYKSEKRSDKRRNEFLRVIAKLMTSHLENDCPLSWLQCQPSFWEELIFTAFPHMMRISPKEQETEQFLTQLQMFVQWLDDRVGTDWHPLIEDLAIKATPELKDCEHLLNALFLRDFPRIHHADWNPQNDIEKINLRFSQCKEKLDSLFEVTSRIDKTIVLTEFATNNIYYVKGLPVKWAVPGIIMSGVIGKQAGERIWRWFQTEGIYSQRGGKYLSLKINH
ncbi:hypothetical protein [Neobacillus sp. Marseille-QA0830]